MRKRAREQAILIDQLLHMSLGQNLLKPSTAVCEQHRSAGTCSKDSSVIILHANQLHELVVVMQLQLQQLP